MKPQDSQIQRWVLVAVLIGAKGSGGGLRAPLALDHVLDSVDQGEVGEGLGEVAKHPPGGGIELLGVKAKRGGVGEQPLKERLGGLLLADLGKGGDQPEGADQEG